MIVHMIEPVRHDGLDYLDGNSYEIDDETGRLWVERGLCQVDLSEEKPKQKTKTKTGE